VIQDNDFKSVVTPRYNCVGFAIGDPNWWDHVGEEGTTWPADLIGRGSLNDYLEVFQRHGFRTCDRAEGTVAVPGWENIAVFQEAGEFSHVAIQLASGRWISKLGDFEDIEHPLEPMEGRFYGDVSTFMKREGYIDRKTRFPLV